jgi:hypothetical protein
MLQASLNPLNPTKAKETKLSNSKSNVSDKDVDVSCKDSNNNNNDNKDVYTNALNN